MIEEKPPLNVSLSEEDKDKILGGATHIAISVLRRQGETAVGNVRCIGTEEQCEAVQPLGFVIVPEGVEYVGEYIWETKDFKSMIEAERERGAP